MKPRVPREFWPFATRPTPEQSRFRHSPEQGEPRADPRAPLYESKLTEPKDKKP